MRPYYRKKPIGSVGALCSALRVSEPALRHLVDNIDKHYTPYQIQKEDGKPRALLIPSLHLKTIQKRINREIFAHIEYPSYLFGGIEKRDYLKNAKAHAPADALIALDVKNFYPSIRFDDVVGVFQYLMKFPRGVSELLARLATHNGRIPQGACTSSHIANLILHDVEYHLVQYFSDCGYKYTRLLDDICISSPRIFSPKRVSMVIEKVAAMLHRKGLKLKNSKTRVTVRSNPKTLMEVTGLWINRGSPRLAVRQRRAIRAEVFQCTRIPVDQRTEREYHVAYASASGKVANLQYLCYSDARRLRIALRPVQPIFSGSEIAKTRKIVDMLSRASIRDRGKYAYSLSYHKTWHRVNIVARTNRPLAETLRLKLSKCRPTRSRDVMLYDELI